MAERHLRNRPRTFAAALVLGLSVGSTACTPMDNLLVSIFGRSMRNQNSLGSYEAPMNPADGSVPFASGNFPSGPGIVNLGQPEGVAVPEPVTPALLLQALLNPDAVPAVTGLVNPVPVSPSSLARGEELFLRNCAPCHGSAGAGDGTVATAAPVFGFSLLSDQGRGLSDGYIYSIIRVGRGAMPPYGHQISHFDRWHVVNYLRQLQGL